MKENIKPWCWNPDLVMVKDENGNIGLVPVKKWKKSIDRWENVDLDDASNNLIRGFSK